MTVRDAMNSELIKVREGDSVLAGLKVLLKEGVSGAPSSLKIRRCWEWLPNSICC